MTHTCPKCSGPLPNRLFLGASSSSCPHCGIALKVSNVLSLIVGLAVQTVVLSIAYAITHPLGEFAAWTISAVVSVLAAWPVFVWLLHIEQQPGA